MPTGYEIKMYRDIEIIRMMLERMAKAEDRQVLALEQLARSAEELMTVIKDFVTVASKIDAILVKPDDMATDT